MQLIWFLVPALSRNAFRNEEAVRLTVPELAATLPQNSRHNRLNLEITARINPTEKTVLWMNRLMEILLLKY